MDFYTNTDDGPAYPSYGKVKGKPRLQREFKGSLDNSVRLLFKIKSKSRAGDIAQWPSVGLMCTVPLCHSFPILEKSKIVRGPSLFFAQFMPFPW